MSKLEENYNYEELIQSLILNNNLKEIKNLFNNKNFLEYKDYALKYSCSNYKTETIVFLINMGADIIFVESYLYGLIDDNNFKKIKELFNDKMFLKYKHSVLLNSLYYASYYGKTEIVNYLISIFDGISFDEYKCLKWACNGNNSECHLDTILCLIENGADFSVIEDEKIKN